MISDLLDRVPKAGVFVKAHLPGILNHIAAVDSAEFQRLLTKDHSSERFRLSYPFFKTVEQINADGDKSKFWKPEHAVQGQRVRVCSQWTDRHRPFFLNYLVTNQIPTIGISPELREEWLAMAEQAGTTSKSPGGARYRSTAIGVAQNAFVRYLLSNLGFEEFKKQDWKAVKTAFGDNCVYCGGAGKLEMDHAIPLSRLQLGEHRLGNLVPACSVCNGKKSHLRFRPYLEAKYDGDRSEADLRMAATELHMARNGYQPLGDRQDICDLLERARQEIAEVGAKYLDLINQAIAHDPPEPVA